MGHGPVKRKNPQFVHGYTTRHDKVVYYLRLPGQKKIRLSIPEGALPWSPEFMAVRAAALNADREWTKPDVGTKRTVVGTVNAAIISYLQSPLFKDGLAESTQNNRRAILEQFGEDHGDKRIALMDQRALQVILDKKSPVVALNWRKALRGFIDHATALNMLKVDPLAGIKLVSVKSNGHHPWEPDECAKFEAHHAIGTRARLAYELLLQVGHSRCDMVRMGRQHVRNGTLSLRRQKTDVAFDVPVMPMLQAAIDAMPPSNHLAFLVTGQGKPFTAAGFGNWFRNQCNAAGLPKRCTSHGLRKAAATRAADRGATTTQLMAWFGWKSSSEAERYTRGADRKRAAATLGEIMLATDGGSPLTPVSQNGTQAIENVGGKK
jgi:integrase